MWLNLALGSLLIAVTVLVQTIGLLTISHLMPKIIKRLNLHRHRLGQTLALMKTVFGLFLVHTVEVWLWAGLYVYLGAISNLEDALSFSTGTFSTVGAPAPLIDPRWHLLASLEGVDGFVLIGWSIAFLVGASTRYGPFPEGKVY